MIRPQQYIKLNTRAKQIQQLNPGRTDNRPKHQAPSIIAVFNELQCLLILS